MKRSKIIAQLESELMTANVCLGDSDTEGTPDPYESAEGVHGYWVGRRFGLRQALTLLHGRELE